MNSNQGRSGFHPTQASAFHVFHAWIYKCFSESSSSRRFVFQGTAFQSTCPGSRAIAGMKAQEASAAQSEKSTPASNCRIDFGKTARCIETYCFKHLQAFTSQSVSPLGSGITRAFFADIAQIHFACPLCECGRFPAIAFFVPFHAYFVDLSAVPWPYLDAKCVVAECFSLWLLVAVSFSILKLQCHTIPCFALGLWHPHCKWVLEQGGQFPLSAARLICKSAGKQWKQLKWEEKEKNKER